MAIRPIFSLERAEALDRPATVLRTVVGRLLTQPHPEGRPARGVARPSRCTPALAQYAVGLLPLGIHVGRPPRAGERQPSPALLGIVPGPGHGAAHRGHSGWADGADSHEDQQRVGLVHAATNGTAVALYAAVLIARRPRPLGQSPCHVTAGLTAGPGRAARRPPRLPAGVGRQPRRGRRPHRSRESGSRSVRSASCPDGKPVPPRRRFMPVFVLRRGLRLDVLPVLSDRCSHLSAPLSRGRAHRLRPRRADRVPVARQRVPAGRRLRRARTGHRTRTTLREPGGRGGRDGGQGGHHPGCSGQLSWSRGGRLDGDPQAQPVVGEPLPRRRDQLVEALRPVGGRGHQRGPGAQHRDVEDDLVRRRRRAPSRCRCAAAPRAGRRGSSAVCTCTAEQSSASATTAPSASSRTIIPPILHRRRTPVHGAGHRLSPAAGPGPSRAAPRRPGRPGSRTRCPPPTPTGRPPAPRW